MRLTTRIALTVIVTGPLLSACGVLGGQQTAPPPPVEQQELTAAPPTEAPAPSPTAVPIAPTAKVGDILFVKDGQVWAVGTDGSAPHALTSLPDGAAIRDLSVSPDGKYAGYTVNGTLAEVYDLAAAKSTTLDLASKSRFDSIAWAADSSAVYYHKLILDDNSVPFRSEIWTVTLPPGGAPERVFQNDLTDGLMSVPEIGLDQGSLVVHEFKAGGGDAGDWMIYNSGTDTSTPIAEGFGLWDVYQGSQLLFKKTELTPGHLTVPIGLYLSTNGGDPQAISPVDDDSAAYTAARFGASAGQIAVLRYTQDSNGAITSGAALLQMGEGGIYNLTLLAADPAAPDVAVVWADATHVVVQRLRGGASELWLLPTDGSAGKVIASGEQPAVVGGR